MTRADRKPPPVHVNAHHAVVAEVVQLRAQISHLWSDLAKYKAKFGELDTLQPADTAKDVAAPSAARTNGPSICAKCGQKCPCEATRPVQKGLPTDIVARIARYFQPGTRDLLNLARISRDVYETLLPRLYETFEMGRVNPTIAKAVRGRGANQSLPYGMTSVKSLTLHLVPDWNQMTMETQTAVLLACDNVVNLRCSIAHFRTLYVSNLKKPLVEHLDLAISEDDSISLDDFGEEIYSHLYTGMPRLRRMLLRGLPWIPIMHLASVSFPFLETVNLDLEDEWEVEPKDMPPTFVEKIRKVECVDPRFVCKAIAKHPSFHVKIVRCSKMPMPRDWHILCSHKALKRLHLTRLKSSALLIGIPPNLQELIVDHFVLDVCQPGHELEQIVSLAKLGGAVTFAQQGRTRLSLHHWLGDTPLSWQSWDGDAKAYFKELSFWARVRGFRIGGEKDELHWVQERMQVLGLETPDLHEQGGGGGPMSPRAGPMTAIPMSPMSPILSRSFWS